jgi:HTH-type transcriptional regulator / antitoxin HigA
MTAALKLSPAAFRKISAAWSQLREHAEIGVIRSGKDYRRMVSLLDGVIDQAGSDEDHRLAGLAELLGDLIERYEEKQVHIPDAEPKAVLDFLMKENGLRQADLAGEIGSQGVVSEILNGKRVINARQAKALAARFGVSPAVFL